MKKVLIAILAGGVVFGTVFAFAATLNVSSNDLAAGDALVAPCDSSGKGAVTYATQYQASPTAGYVVTTVTIAGLDSTCNDRNASATLTNSGGANIGDGSAKVTTGTATITIAAKPTAQTVSHIYVIVTQ